MKIKESKNQIVDLSDDEDDGIKDYEDQSRDSLSTNLDWNDKEQLEQYCTKMKKIEKTKDFRPSQYFGAITIDKLEDGVNDSRIDGKIPFSLNLCTELFLDCFGIKPKP